MELSLILCSRNDEYMGNSRWRLETTLNSLGDRVRALGRAHELEVLVTDWGSTAPLRDVIRLAPPAAEIVSFVTIPPALAHRRQGDSPFPEVLALNAAARRARGRFIGRIDQDTLVGMRFLRWFFDGLDAGASPPAPPEKTLFFANRRSIPYRLAVRCPDRRHIERFVRLFGRWCPIDRANPWFGDEFWTSYVGIWLAHRSLWEESGGYDERMIYYNWMETDLIRRLRQKYPLVDLGRLTGFDFYHLEHYDPRAPGAARLHVRKNADIDRTSPVPQMRPNGPAWGLADCDLAPRPSAVAPAAAAARPGLASLRDAGAFAGLATRVAVEMTADRVVIKLAHTLAVARRRMAAATRGLSGQPVRFWPGTLWKLWHGRKINRAR
jgi:hypothetical protein